MPAYSVPLTPKVCQKCSGKAYVTVFNGQNAVIGFFCATHGRQMVDDLNAPAKEPSRSSA